MLALVLAGVLVGAVGSFGAVASPVRFLRPINSKRLPIGALRSWGGAACPTSKLCIASDGTPRILTSTDPTGGRRAWTLGAIGSDGDIESLACASTALCVAWGADDLTPGVWTSTDPAGGAATWTFSSFAFVPVEVVMGLSCPSVSLCVGVDEVGHVLVSTDPTGGVGAWSLSSFDPGGDLVGVSCPSIHLCVAADIDGAIFATTDPLASPGSWRRTRRPTNGRGFLGISCPTARLCVAVGSGVAVSTRPTRAGSWRFERTPRRSLFRGLTSVTCASAHLCIAGDGAGFAFVSADPTAGLSAWEIVRIHKPTGVVSTTKIGCSPSRRPLCVLDGNASEWLIVAEAAPRSRGHHRRRRR